MTNPSWFVEEDDTGLIRRMGWYLQLNGAAWAEIETFFEKLRRDHPGPKAELEERLVGIEVFLEQFWTEQGAVRVEVDGVPYLKTKPSSWVSIGVSVKASRLLQEARAALAAGDMDLGMLLALDLGICCNQLEAVTRIGPAAKAGRKSLVTLEMGRDVRRENIEMLRDRDAELKRLAAECRADPKKRGLAGRIKKRLDPWCDEHGVDRISEARIRQLY